MKPEIADGLYAAFDVGTNSVKAVIIDHSGQKNRIAAVETETFKPQADFPGETEFRDHQLEILKQLAGRLPLKNCRECLALFNNREMQVKIVDLPKEIQSEQVEGVLVWEAKKLLSPALKNEPFLFTFKQVRETSSSYVLAVIPQVRVEKATEFFAAAGIPITGFYPEVFTTTAIKEKLPTSGLPALSLINIGHFNTHIQIFSAGEMKFYRHIPSGSAEIAADATPKDLEVFAQKIRFSFDYFRAITKLPHIDEILFMGGGARAKQFTAFSRDYFLPGKVMLVDLTSCFDVSPVLGSLSGDTQPLLSYYPALGAFLAHDSAHSAFFNFAARRRKILDQERYSRMASTLPIGFGALGLAIAFLIIALMNQSAAARTEEARQAASIAEIAAAKARTNLMKAQVPRQKIELTRFERKALRHLLRDRLSGAEILFKVAMAKPDNLTLKQLAIQARPETDDTGQEGILALPPENPETTQDPVAAADDEALSGISLGRTPGDAPPVEEAQETPPDQSENLGEEVLIVKGTCDRFDTLTAFLEKLKKSGVMLRYRLVQSVKKGDKIRFSCMGEIP